jgi:predicted dehydrogenase
MRNRLVKQAHDVRVGVIGVGVMGERHARILSELDGVELVGVLDADHARAQAVCEQFGGRPFTDLDAFFGAIDAVTIAAPTFAHADLALTALDHGRHVMIEKPIASTVADARRIIERSTEASEQVVMVGHIERFNPAVTELRRHLAGRRALTATFRRMSQWDERCLDTDVVHDLMIHDIDLLVHLFGDRVQLTDAVGSSIRSGKIDHAIAQFSLDRGPAMTLIASRVAERRARSIEVRTADAWICVDLIGRTLSKSYLSVLDANGIAWPLEHETYGGSEYFPVPAGEPLRLELAHFIACVRGGQRPLVDAVGGFRALAYADAITDIIDRKNVADRRGAAIAQSAAL